MKRIYRTATRLLTCISLATLLGACCSGPEILEKPVLVEVEKKVYAEIQPELTECIPVSLTSRSETHCDTGGPTDLPP